MRFRPLYSYSIDKNMQFNNILLRCYVYVYSTANDSSLLYFSKNIICANNLQLESSYALYQKYLIKQRPDDRRCFS